MFPASDAPTLQGDFSSFCGTSAALTRYTVTLNDSPDDFQEQSTLQIYQEATGSVPNASVRQGLGLAASRGWPGSEGDNKAFSLEKKQEATVLKFYNEKKCSSYLIKLPKLLALNITLDFEK